MAAELQQKETIHATMQAMGAKAKAAYRVLATVSSETKKAALKEAATHVRKSSDAILEANAKDMEAARTKGLTGAMLDRLALNPERIEAIAAGLDAIAELPDPVGIIQEQWQGPGNGLNIQKVSVPLGVIGIIYESRPNVTADAGGLCIKSGNAAILRGGSESFHSSRALVECMHAALEKHQLPKEAVQLVPTTDRAAVGALLTMTEHVDVIVPRGGLSLTERVAKESRIPTILHLDGNCHCYIHSSADIEKAVQVVTNAKMRRTGICGATESLVIDEAILAEALPKLVDSLSAKGCIIKGDAKAQATDSRVQPATDEDWGTEYLDAMISVKTVQNLEEAITHINRYSSHHTDCILAEDEAAQQRYAAEIDSAIVMINSSTQFADGGEFGMGAEIGISTGRLHARGPVGASQLTTYKYVVRSDGATRS